MFKRRVMRLLPLIAFCLLMSCREAPPANSPRVSTTQSSDVEAREAVEPKLRGIVRNPNFDEKITPEVQQIVVDFMEQWFAAQADLSQPDFSNLFDKTTLQGREALAFNEMILSCLTEIRSSRPNDLTFSDYDYGITFWRAKEEEDGSLRIAFMEDSRIRFAFLPETVSSHVGYHSMTLTPVNGRYKITSHLDRQDAGLTAFKEYEERKIEIGFTQETLTNSDVNRLLADIKSEILANAGGRLEEQPAIAPDAPPENSYDREAAVRYAEQWVGDIQELRNEEWQNFEMYGGDCNNFVSQCLFEAGVPMDIQGNAQWKWYGDTINAANTASGRVPSWSGVGPFYDYCRLNEGYGLSAQVDMDFREAEPGDIIQFGVLGRWMHSVIITEVIRNQAGNPIDFLVAAHSADRKKYPASAYYFPTARLIKIAGWNS